MSGKQRIIIIVGHYGSGKTEVAVNYALSLAEYGKVAVIDLDIVNPYFRSREAREIIEERGVRVVCPEGEAGHADIPALSPVILGMIENEEYQVVIDVGGDDMGARALGRFQNQLAPKGYEMILVVNPYRPQTSEIKDVKQLAREIEAASRLKISSIIANPHLASETTPEIVAKGIEFVQDVANNLNLPIKFVSIKEGISYQKKIENLHYTLLPLKLFMLPPWF